MNQEKPDFLKKLENTESSCGPDYKDTEEQKSGFTPKEIGLDRHVISADSFINKIQL